METIIDQSCVELAEYFLDGGEDCDTPENRKLLAEMIQQAVDDFFGDPLE